MLDFLKHVLAGQNQFASGGLLLMIVGGIGVYLRALPQRFWWWLEHQTTMTLTIKDEDMAFRWVKEWFLEQEFLKRIRRVDVDTTLRGAEIALVPAPGRHWFWREGRPFWVWCYRSEENKGWQSKRTESLTFQTIGRDRDFLKKFVDEIVACHRRKTQASSFLYVYGEGWNQIEAYHPRWLDSVILKLGEKERLVDDIEKFRASRQRYRRLGVPYHRGYLLYGPPGTGKTSLVSGLAAKFGMSIYAINLTEFNDRTLRSAVNDVPEGSVVLLEDIDCMKAGHKREVTTETPVIPAVTQKSDPVEQHGVTLSGLLNVLDGFHAPENVLFVMTTNKLETLDPALLRPGRIDYKLYMGQATIAQKVELYCRFFPSANAVEALRFSELHDAETMAQFQGLLLALERKAEGFEADLLIKESALEEVAS